MAVLTPNRVVAIFALGSLLGLCGGTGERGESMLVRTPGTEHAPIAELVEDPTLRYGALFDAAPTEHEQRRVLAAAAAEAAAMRSRGEPGSGALLRFAASALRGLGDDGQAAALLALVLDDPESSQEFVSAARMEGQWRTADGDYLGAMAAYREAIALTRADPEGTIMVSPGGVQSVVSQHATLAQMFGRTDEALDSLSILFGADRDLFDPAAVRAALGSAARIHEGRGESDAARLRLTELFLSFPGYGLESDSGIGTRLRFLRLRAGVEGEQVLLDGLRAMWTAPGLADSYRALAVGQAIVAWFEERGDHDGAMLALWNLANRAETVSLRGVDDQRGDAREIFFETLVEIATVAIAHDAEADAEMAALILDRELPQEHAARPFVEALQDKLSHGD